MKKMKQILAWIGILILLSLYIVTFVVSFIQPAVTSGLLMACIFATVAVPCLCYAFQLVYRILQTSNKNTSSKQNKASKSQKQDEHSD